MKLPEFKTSLVLAGFTLSGLLFIVDATIGLAGDPPLVIILIPAMWAIILVLFVKAHGK